MSEPSSTAVAAHEAFRKFSKQSAHVVGSPYSFGVAVGCITLWLASGPYFAFSAEWGLFVHTTTSVAAFLMLFVLQNGQNRDNRTIQLKLDELILQLRGPRDVFAALERMPEAELRAVEAEAAALREEAACDAFSAAPTKPP